MAKYLGWISTTVIALAGLVMGIFAVDFGPRWVWFAIGILFGFLAAGTFKTAWGSTNQTNPPPAEKTVDQSPTMTAGSNSTQIVSEGGGTFYVDKSKDH